MKCLNKQFFVCSSDYDQEMPKAHSAAQSMVLRERGKKL